MTDIIILIVFALIGLIVGYALISIRLKSAKKAAELTLLNAEQDAVNLRGKADSTNSRARKQISPQRDANRS